MKRLGILVLLLIIVTPAFGQVNELYGEARGSYYAAITDGAYKSSFRAEYVNVILDGNIGPNISFYWRQRFSKPLYNQDIPLNATDHLWLRWDMSQHWAIQVGKIPIVVGGYEFDDAPIDLYYWSVFANNMPDVYALGGNFICKINPQQTLQLQVTQSPLGFGYTNLFHTALIWYGQIAPWWNTIWSVNWLDDPAHSGYLVAGLGNRLEFGNLGLELDAMYRTGAARQALAADYSAILKIEYKFPVVTVFAKGSYDYNKDFEADFVPVGTNAFILGGGVEVFPLKNNDIRLHAVGWWNSDVKTTNMAFGLTYRLRVVKKSSSISS